MASPSRPGQREIDGVRRLGIFFNLANTFSLPDHDQVGLEIVLDVYAERLLEGPSRGRVTPQPRFLARIYDSLGFRRRFDDD